eukprot:symbB.v1.2.023824.t1/scaffold2199.1/size85959/5
MPFLPECDVLTRKNACRIKAKRQRVDVSARQCSANGFSTLRVRLANLILSCPDVKSTAIKINLNQMDAGKLPQSNHFRAKLFPTNLPAPRQRTDQNFHRRNYGSGLAPLALPLARKLCRVPWTRRPTARLSQPVGSGPDFESEVPPPDSLPVGWKDVGDVEVFFPRCAPKRRIHFLGGAFVGVSPRLFYKDFLEKIATNCEAIVVATPYQLSFDYDAMAEAAAGSFERASSQLAEHHPVCGSLPIVAVGHSCGALIHALLAAAGTEYQACVLMSFNNKPISDAIPVPLPDAPENPRFRELARSNVEALLADENVEETLRTARALLQSAGFDSSGSKPEIERKAAPVVHWPRACVETQTDPILLIKGHNLAPCWEVWSTVKRNSPSHERRSSNACLHIFL